MNFESRFSRSRWSLASTIILPILILSENACLPDDTRATPGRLDVSVAGNAHEPIVTSDGWEIAFSEFLLSIGDLRLLGDDCNEYNEVDYLRLVNLTREGSQRLATPYARGPCDIAYRIGAPDADAVLGTGVTENDKTRLRTSGGDAIVENAGISLSVTGTASRDGTTKVFAWPFRADLPYECTGPEGRPAVTLDQATDHAQQIEVRAEALFQQAPEDGAAVLFEPFAEADDLHGNADGAVSIDELAATPSSSPEGPATLAELLYFEVLPRVPRFTSGLVCVRRPPDDDD